MDKKSVFTVPALRCFMEKCLASAGLPSEDAAAVADNLLYSELQGIRSHGLTRFAIYLKRVEEGFVKARPAIQITRTVPAVLSVDGDNGLGTVVAARALAAGMEAVENYGICAVGVRRSNHFGAAGYYCRLAADRGYISILFTNAPPAMPPWGGSEAFFGTNPIAFGVPRQKRPHIIVDMATSMVARGKIIAAAKAGKAIPDSWALDPDGNPTTDPQAALKGVLLPMAGPKGYALSMIVDHLAGVLQGAAYGPQIINQYSGIRAEANVGHFIILIKPEAFGDAARYAQRTEEWIYKIKAVPAMPGVEAVMLPGEREWILEQQQSKDGLQLSQEVVDELLGIAARKGVELAM